MARVNIFGIAAFVLFTTTIPCLGQKYTRHPGVKFAPPGSWSTDCTAGVRCSSLYCAAQCSAAGVRCRAFSYSVTGSTCLLADQAFSLSATSSVLDLHWSAYGRRKSGRLCRHLFSFLLRSQSPSPFSSVLCRNFSPPPFFFLLLLRTL